MSNDTQATTSDESAEDYVFAFQTEDDSLRLGSEQNHEAYVESENFVDLKETI